MPSTTASPTSASQRGAVVRALHVGPHVYSFGGTQSVIRTIRDNTIGADSIEAVPTWNAAGVKDDARLVAQAARKIAKEPKSTLVHFHISNGGAWLREGFLIHLAAARGMRVVVTLHGYDFPEFAAKHPRPIRAVLRRADHVICLSTEARDVLTGLIGLPRVSIVDNPVTLDDASPTADHTPPVALFAGTIGIRKGVDVLAKAWEQLIAEGIDGTLRIVGEQDDYAPAAQPQLSIEDPIHPNDVPALLREARVIVLPSRAEGMPMILTEALAAGRPFVATPVGGTGSITPDPQMLVPVDDAAALAEAIGRYLRDPAAARAAGEAGREWIRETRSPAVIDRKLREIYASIT